MSEPKFECFGSLQSFALMQSSSELVKAYGLEPATCNVLYIVDATDHGGQRANVHKLQFILAEINPSPETSQKFTALREAFGQEGSNEFFEITSDAFGPLSAEAYEPLSDAIRAALAKTKSGGRV